MNSLFLSLFPAARRLASAAALFILAVSSARAQSPNWTSTSGPSTATANQSVSYSFSATDPNGDLSLMEVAWRTPSGGVWAIYPWFSIGGPTSSATVSRSVTFNQGTGTYELWANARDVNGNTRDAWAQNIPSERKSITVSNTSNSPASCTGIWASTYSLSVGQSAVIYVSGYDPDGNLRYVNVDQTYPYNGYYGPGNTGTQIPPNNGWWDIGSNQFNYTRALTITFNAAGTYTFRGAVNDGTGWNYSSGTINITVNSATNTPPSISMSPTGTQSITLGQSITYSSSASDANGNMDYHNFDWRDPEGRWAWEGGAGINLNTGREVYLGSSSSSSRSIVVTPTRTGTFRIRWAAHDAAGWVWTSEYDLIVNGANHVPTSTISASATSITAGQTVVLTASASDVDGNLRYLNIDQTSPNNGWYGNVNTGTQVPPNGAHYDIGYNTSSFSRNLTLTLQNPGTYVFRAAANDSTGWYYSSNTVTVTVTSAPGGSWTNIFAESGYIESHERTDEEGNGTGEYESSSNWHYFNVPGNGTLRVYTTGWTDTAGWVYDQNWSYRGMDYDSGPSPANFQVTVTNVVAGQHKVVVGGQNGDTSGDYIVFADFLAAAPPPAAPTATAATAIASTSFTANWNASSGATSYRLDVATNSSFTSYVSGYQNRDVGSATSFSVTGLSMGTDYFYRVRAVSSAGTSGNSGTIQATTTASIPNAPTIGSATSVTGTSFTANWGTSAGASSYRLDVSPNSSFSSFVSGYQDRNVGNVTSSAVTGLGVGVTYYYRVRAVNTAGTSSNSGVGSVTTVAGPINGNGTGLIGEYFNGRDLNDHRFTNYGEVVDFDWGGGGPGSGDGWSDEESGDSGEDNFSIRWSGRVMPRYTGAYTFITTSDDGVRLWVNGALVIDRWYDMGASDHSSAPITLTAGQLYSIKMEYYENGGDAVAKLSWESSAQSREIIPYSQLYRPGSNQPAVSSGPATATVGQAWTPAVSGGYNGGAGSGQWEFRVAGATSFSPNAWTPTAAGPYQFYVIKRGDATYNDSAEAGPYTLTVGSAIAAPTALASTNVSTSGFNANWSAVSGASGYRLDVSLSSTFGTFVSGYSDRDVGNVTTFAVSGLAAGTTYYYRVRAIAGANTSASSNTISATTASVAPPTVSGGSASATSGTTFNYQVVATNAPTAYFATGLPAGLSINQTTGVISGTPTQTGTFSVTLTAQNAGGTSSAVTLTITVAAAGSTIISGSPAGVVGSTFSYSITSDVPSDLRQNYNYTATGLPAGLSVHAKSGYISGVPTQAGSFNVALSVSNTQGSASASRTFTIAASMPATSIAAQQDSIAAGGTRFNERIFSATTSNGNLTWLSAPPRYFSFLYTPVGIFDQQNAYVSITITPTRAGETYRYRMDFGNGTTPNVATYVGALTTTEFPLPDQADRSLPGGATPETLRLDPNHWALRNTTTSYPDGRGFDLSPKTIWDGGNAGSGQITVLVMDTGVQDRNPALPNIVRANFSADAGSNSGGLPFPQSLYHDDPDSPEYLNGPDSLSEEDHIRVLTESHGTKVAGAVAGLYLNSSDSTLDKTAIGVAPGIRIAAAKIATASPDFGEGSLNLNTLNVINAINWGLAQGARISVSSFGTTFAAGSLDAAFADARGSDFFKSLYTSPYAGSQAVGMLHFVATGNAFATNLNNAYPANLPSVIAIGAVTKQGTRAAFSNYGTGMGYVAPGEAVMTAYPTWLPRRPGSEEKSIGFTEEVNQVWSFMPALRVGATDYRAAPATYSARTTASGELVDGGGAGTVNSAWLGKVVLVNIAQVAGQTYFYDLVRRVEQSGGIACVFTGTGFTPSLVNPQTNQPYRSAIPVLDISQTDGNTVRALITSQPGTTGAINRPFAWNANRTNSGTSFAAPYAAGVAALLLSQNPTWTASMVEQRLQLTARRLSSWPAGYDTQYGWGMLSASDAAKPGVLNLLNLSTRAQVVSSTNGELIMGFVIRGSMSKPTLIRAVGPKLSAFGIGGTLNSPVLTLRRQSDNSVVATNTSWTTASNASAIQTMSAAVGAFPLTTTGGDSALLLDLPAGAYSAVITGAGGATGVALAEVYDATGSDPIDAQLVNLSTRAYVGTGENVMFGGFVVEGSSPRSVMIRAVGPSLPGVSGSLANPRLRLLKWVSGAWQEIATNDDWGAASNARAIRGFAAAVGAFALEEGSTDAAILMDLTKGMYSVEVSGVGNTTGVALVEVYPAVD